MKKPIFFLYTSLFFIQQNNSYSQEKTIERIGSESLPINQQPINPYGAWNTNDLNNLNGPKTDSGKKTFSTTTFAPGKSIYLNGVNISSIKGQNLNNVNIKIDQEGNLFIEAPQYEVSTEERYHPLLPNELPKREKDFLKEMSMRRNELYSKEGNTATALNQINNTEAQGIPTSTTPPSPAEPATQASPAAPTTPPNSAIPTPTPAPTASK